MKKPVKICLWTLAGLVGLVVLMLLSLPLWIGGVVKSVSESLVPEYTGCAFKMESFSLNPFTGRLQITEAHLANPQGYAQDVEAFSVATVRVDVAVCSLLSSTIHVREISIENPFVSYVSENGTNNFAAIAATAKGKLGSAEETPAAEAEKKAEEEKAGTKVVIDRFYLAGTRVKLGILPLALPTIELKDIGKESGGATFSDVCATVGSSVTKFMTDAGGTAANALKSVTGGAGDALKDATGKAGEAAGKAADAVGQGVKDAAESLRKLNPFGR